MYTKTSGVIPINGERMTNEELSQAYEQYHNMVYRLALVKTKSVSLAEDIQQDVFMALVRYSDRIRDMEHLKAWLIHVTQNACRKHFRSMWIKLSVQFDDALSKDESPSEPASEDNTPEEALEQQEDITLMKEAVEQLGEAYRTVIHLFYYEDMSVHQIAQSLGISEQNVKTRLSRARDKLKTSVELQT